MPSTGQIFGAAILNALGKGVEGFGEGQTAYQKYYLDKIKAEKENKSNLQKEMELLYGSEAVQNMPVQDRVTKGLEVLRAGRPEVMPQQPTASQSRETLAERAAGEMEKTGEISPATAGALGKEGVRSVRQAYNRSHGKVEQ